MDLELIDVEGGLFVFVSDNDYGVVIIDIGLMM